MINRVRYLDKIEPFIDNCELIKILTGVRRCGKSTILTQIINNVREDKNTNVIYINFESIKFESITTYMNLYEYIVERISENKINYIFIDEIQKINQFEKVINSLRVDYRCSIFITGSNASLLSSQISTLLTGRYVTFYIQTLNYSEFLELNNLESNEKVLMEYITYGGFPLLSSLVNDDEKRSYLSDLLNSITFKDILATKNIVIKNSEILRIFVNYVIQNTSEIISVKSIVNYFKSISYNTTPDTLYSYLSLITDAHIVSECKKYDLKGKKELVRNSKYYVTDLGLRNVTLNSENIDFSKSIETLVYNHLIACGYSVFYGKIGEYEVDFVAIKKGKNLKTVKKYLQVSHLISSDDIKEREFRSLKMIKDNHPKYVVTNDMFDLSENGIEHIKLIDLLLDDEF